MEVNSVWDNLPKGLFLHIYGFIDNIQEGPKLTLVNKRFYQFLKTNIVYSNVICDNLSENNLAIFEDIIAQNNHRLEVIHLCHDEFDSSLKITDDLIQNLLTIPAARDLKIKRK